MMFVMDLFDRNQCTFGTAGQLFGIRSCFGNALMVIVQEPRFGGVHLQGDLPVHPYLHGYHSGRNIPPMSKEIPEKANQGRQITSQFEALFEYASIGMLVTDNRGRITRFNSQAENQFGYSRDEIIGQSVEVLIPDQLRSKHENLRGAYHARPGNRAMGINRDLHGRMKDGTVFPVEVSLSHFKMDDDVFVIAFIIDITVRKQNELSIINQQKELERVSNEIRNLNSQLEEKVEARTKMLRETLTELEQSREELSRLLKKEKELGDMKSKFVTLASHEFRTPLSTILSSATLVGKYDRPEDAEKREKHLRRIRDSVENMKNILEDFLSLGKIEEGLIKLQPETLTELEFRDEILRIITEMQALARDNQHIRYEHGSLAEVFIDLKMLRHILTNLVSNALKFSPDGGDIVVSSYHNAGELILEVADQGIGIPEEEQRHLFERFFRAENAANIQGTGLGLYIIARYMEMAGGRIDWKSKHGTGTTFTLILPQP